MKDLYREAIIKGVETHRLQRENAGRKLAVSQIAALEIHGPDGPGYWIAWHAARGTALALLDEAERIGVTKEQLEALRVVAAEVAYD